MLLLSLDIIFVVLSMTFADAEACACCIDPWSSFSSGYSGKVSECGPERIASEPDSQLGTARIFPASSIINVEGVQSVRPEISQSGLARKLPVQGVAPSPMALWPHLFPKVSTRIVAAVCCVCNENVLLMFTLFQIIETSFIDDNVEHVRSVFRRLTL